MLRYVLETSTEGGSYYEDFGDNAIVASGQAAAIVDALLAQGYVVAAYAGAPVWDVSKDGCRFVLALYSKPDEGANGGVYMPGNTFRPAEEN